ncbi:MAG: hypothetical protein AAF467_12290 [Actinomycetota bacterium]
MNRLHRELTVRHARWRCWVDARAEEAGAADPEQGDVAPRTIGIAIMAALAVTVGAIITTVVTGWANSVPTAP